ncbi:MAG: amino acid ABC transporter substrate-binding protein [Rhodospirillales bacterium]|nr:amino acid ABC transporter substrate-binding protein [Rhodospirillales bacterium]
MKSILRAILLAGLAVLGTLAPAQAQQPIKIGMAVSQTGTLGGGGRAALLGVKMWVEDVNAKGGLLGRKVELIAYDDQSQPSTTPTLYTKLLDVDKVDLLIGPYASVPTAPIMPIIKQRDLLLMSNFTFELNRDLKHDKVFNNAPWTNAENLTGGMFDIAVKAGAKKVAFLAADQEFTQNVTAGAKRIAKRLNLETVYEQIYPPGNVDFSAMIRAIRAAKPDIVFVASYPNESAVILRGVNEIGVGDSVKVFGGAMIGLQFGPVMENLGSLMNGVINFTSYVPEKTMDYPGVRDFLARYTKRADEEKVDPLGYYLPPFSYAIGQMLEQAVTATKSLDHKVLAAHLHKNEMKTIVGSIAFDALGERAKPSVPMVQFQNVADKNMEQFRQPGKMVIVAPPELKSGEAVVPFEKARKK